MQNGIATLGVTRRRVIKSMVTLGVAGILLKYCQFPSLKSDNIQLDQSHKNSPSTLKIFTNLSAIVTLQNDLNPKVIKLLHDTFIDEPFGKDHILGSYQKIEKYLVRSKITTNNRPIFIDSDWKFTKGEKWFLSHLLTTWYLGVYYHESRPTIRLIYEDSLMFNATRDIIPVPFLEATGSSGWTKLPEVAS